MTPGTVILALKSRRRGGHRALLSLLALAAGGGNAWHGRINTVFFILTAPTVLGFEAVIRLVNPT